MYSRHSVRLGEHTISTTIDCYNRREPSSCSSDKPPIQDIKIDHTTIHPNYNKMLKVNDIALIRLKTKAQFKDISNVVTICLPVKPEQMIDNIVLFEENTPISMSISGWGYTDDNQNISDYMMHAQVPYLDQTDCVQKFQTLRSRIQMIDFDVTDTHLVEKSFILSFLRKH